MIRIAALTSALQLTLLSFVAAQQPASAEIAARPSDRPNIIYILADDLGYGDLGCYGSVKNATPNIDALAASGVRMTDFHAAPWCAPSRRALMTGCHASRPWGDKSSRLASAITIPEMLKQSDYATALIGKWHLGMGKGLHPLDQGFDYWYGTRGSNDWDGPTPNFGSFREAPESAWKTPLFVNRENKGPVVKQSEFTGRYTEQSIRFIEENKERPFFLYLAHNMPHVPVFASESFRGKSQNGVYGDVIEELDWSVGEILKTLDKNGLRKNTIVVFTSDNGPWSMFEKFGGVADPLRGEKSTTWEGGERVPCVVSWPGQFPPAVCSEWMINYDMYSTIATLTGSSVTEGHAIDSLDMTDVFRKGQSSPRTKHLYFFRQPMAYRSGNYKIHFFTRERGREPETGKPEASVRQTPELLFNVRSDAAESNNIARAHPEIVARLKNEANEVEAAIKNWMPFSK